MKVFHPFTGVKPEKPKLISEDHFNSASEFVGSPGINTTSGQYSRMISGSIESCLYYLRRLDRANRTLHG